MHESTARHKEGFNDDLADGGWDNINAKHYALIARHLGTGRGRGQRVLITFGAAHKHGSCASCVNATT